MTECSLTLYVKSSKKAVGIEETGSYMVEPQYAYPAMNPKLLRIYKPEAEIEYEYVLPKEQRKALGIVETFAREYGYKLRIVDVTRSGGAKKLISKELRKMRVFPTLILDSGERIEGKISRDGLRAVMSKNR